MPACLLCHEDDCRHSRVDAAVLANRADPNPTTRAAVIAAMQASNDEFLRTQTIDFMERTMR
jgi:hypothetical protein